ncbi:hypothetical protein J4Q44_G00268490 [Coregonus suidteri]|uniref:Uncharacterized protein n=1 Tax=Coregonus suidteri TaxID=861788 RepID=A0AAN8QEH7_9TELE
MIRCLWDPGCWPSSSLLCVDQLSSRSFRAFGWACRMTCPPRPFHSVSAQPSTTSLSSMTSHYPSLNILSLLKLHTARPRTMSHCLALLVTFCS